MLLTFWQLLLHSKERRHPFATRWHQGEQIVTDWTKQKSQRRESRAAEIDDHFKKLTDNFFSD